MKKKPLEAKQRNQLKDQVMSLISSIGVCPCCWEIYEFCDKDPFAVCACGTTEWTGQRPLLERLKKIEQALPDDE